MSFAASSVLPAEVLIADDGSTAETENVIREMQGKFGGLFPVVHVRQEHEGIRKQRIVNEAVRRSTGDYLFFTDGDCTVHRHCLREHQRRSDPLAILAGQRVQIGKELTERLLASRTVINGLTFELLLDFAARRSHHAQEALVIRNGLFRRLLNKERIKPTTSVIGCNCSLSKKLFLDINGYDEDFLGFGDEDADLGIRVINRGGDIRSVRNLAIVYHHHHPGSWDMTTDQFKFNAAIKQRRIENKEAYCKNGITKMT
jgi:cellulose synthase/poly-beta-1,6-N-acetylglucosamine synthase-like glycosyltransferase